MHQVSRIRAFLQPFLAAALLATSVLLLDGCTSVPALQRAISQYGLMSFSLQAKQFQVMVLQKNESPLVSQRLHIYLEGDGRPWQGDQPAFDPSGTHLLALKMMLQDPVPSAYLTRPCYHRADPDRQVAGLCEANHWTSGRYSPIIVAAMVDAVEALVEERNAAELSLVGYSGGGTLALLIANQLSSPPARVVTVAAVLDTTRWTEFHKLLPLTQSLNPIDEVSASSAFQQVHLFGVKDTVVPPHLNQHYADRHTKAHYLSFDDFGHQCCWAQQWPDVLNSIADLN
ncbi:MAG: alpha/beta fold hydrolase [Pseudomonadales bacterium]